MYGGHCFKTSKQSIQPFIRNCALLNLDFTQKMCRCYMKYNYKALPWNKFCLLRKRENFRHIASFYLEPQTEPFQQRILVLLKFSLKCKTKMVVKDIRMQFQIFWYLLKFWWNIDAFCTSHDSISAFQPYHDYKLYNSHVSTFYN